MGELGGGMGSGTFRVALQMGSENDLGLGVCAADWVWDGSGTWAEMLWRDDFTGGLCGGEVWGEY